VRLRRTRAADATTDTVTPRGLLQAMWSTRLLPGRTGVALLTAIGLLSGLTTAASADGAGAEPPDPEVAALQDSSTLETPIVGAGRITHTDGGPAVATQLVLLAWPSNDVTARHVVGDKVKLQPVAKATSGSDGQFSLRLPDNERLEPLAGSDGIINLMITATEGGDSIPPFSFTRQLNAKQLPGGGKQLALTALGAESSDLTAADPVDVDLRLEDFATEERTKSWAQADESAEVQSTVEPMQKYYITELVADYGPKWNLVGQHYSIINNVATQFEYVRTAKSEIGIAVSATGGFGTFKQNGTTGKSSTDTVTYAKTGHYAKRYHDTTFRLGKYRISEYSTQGPLIRRWYSVQPLNWTGGSRTRILQTAPAASYCGPAWAARTKWVKDRTQAVTWGNGFDISGTIGIDVSTSTGYSSTAKLTYEFGSTRHVCGTNDLATGNASELVSKQ